MIERILQIMDELQTQIDGLMQDLRDRDDKIEELEDEVSSLITNKNNLIETLKEIRTLASNAI